MITQELFDTLPQLDRIEFRQKEDRIWEKYSSSLTPIVIFFSLGAFIIGSLFIGLCFGGEAMILFMEDFADNLIFILVAVIITFTADIYCFINRHKKIKELYDKYFTFETKLKKESKNGKRK